MTLRTSEKFLLIRETLMTRISEMGEEITRDYQGKDLVVIGILKGAVMFLADLGKTDKASP